MNEFFHTVPVLLCRFSEGDGGDAGAVTGVTATDAASPSGEKPRDAAVENSSREQAFLSLIKGEYRDLYDARVSETVRGRLKRSEKALERARAAEPTLSLLSDLLGEDPCDADAIGKRLRGLLDGEKKGEAKEAHTRARVREQYDAWAREARTLAERYRGFDVESELQSPQFRALLCSGLDMQTALECVHRREILASALSHATEQLQHALTLSLAASAARPTENGIIPHASVSATRDVSRMSRAERAEIARRVSEGERITF